MTSKSSESLISRPDFQLVSSRGFVDWLGEKPLALAVTTYHVGGIIMLGRRIDLSPSTHIAAFDRAMGCSTDGQTMWLVTERAIWRLENDLGHGQTDDQGYDRVFVPRVGYMTGEVDAHELSVGADGRPVFVNTAFSCLATIDDRLSFRPLWKPPFISELVPEDRCHLSGLAMADGVPRYVTMHAASDVADGWRDFRATGGRVMDVQTSEVYADRLSMPHSPRLVDGRLWLCNSGTGFVGFIDPSTRTFEPVTFVPGYARGLAFFGDYAFVGLSKPRREHAFQGLPLQKNLEQRGAASRCGLQVIDLRTGAVIHWVRIESEIEELFDVAVLPGVRQPKALSFHSSTYATQLAFVHEGRLQRTTVAGAAKPTKPARPDRSARTPSPPTSAVAPSVTSADHRSARSLNNLGLSKALAGEFDEARDYFEKAVSLDPSHAGAHNNLGNVYRERRMLDLAIDCYSASVAADPTYSKAYFNLGRTLAALGRFAEAAAALSRGLKTDSNNVDAAISLAEALRAQGKYEDAIRCYQQVQSLAPENQSAHIGLGKLHHTLGNRDAAMVSFAHARAVGTSAAGLVETGDAFASLEQLDEAKDCYAKALALDPNFVTARQRLGLLDQPAALREQST